LSAERKVKEEYYVGRRKGKAEGHSKMLGLWIMQVRRRREGKRQKIIWSVNALGV
jgi:hypothetical protein